MQGGKFVHFEKKEYLKRIFTYLGILEILKYIYRGYYLYRHLKTQCLSVIRKNFEYNDCCRELKKYKNIHKGKRCFVIATGPSLTLEDVEKLKNEYTFGMNSLYKIYDKTDWRPTYYAIQDSKVYSILIQEKAFRDIEHLFISDFVCEEHGRDESSVVFPLDLLDHMYYKKKTKFTTKFSDNAYGIVYDGASITYSVLQLAYYMGFSEIYLLGCDCNYSGERTHFADYGYVSENNPEYNMLSAYAVAYEFTTNHNLKIYNATRGGKLEIFERVNLDDII